MKTLIIILSLLSTVAILVPDASAQLSALGRNESVDSSRKLPKKTIQDDLVLLDVKHIRQKPGNCVPTSCAMILRYLGESASPVALKKLAENHKPKEKRNKDFTYWKDMLHALKQKGHDWNIKRYEKTVAGFERGFNDLKTSLKNGLPVMVEVHLDAGHSFVLIGFDDKRGLVFVRDPLLDAKEVRIISTEKLKACWHNHKYGNNRSAMFPAQPIE